MKRINIITACVLLAVFALGLTGFTLADARAGGGAGEDRLIGVLLTREPLDLFDMESYLNDHLNSFQNGGEITGDTGPYEGRVYATRADETLTDDSGRTRFMPNYTFDTVEGIAYFAAKISDGTNIYTATGGDEGISDGHTNIGVTAAGDSIEMTGIIYVAPSDRYISWYFNPVYQAADGRVYAMSGQGMAAEYYGEGTTNSHFMDATYTVTENGETTTTGLSIKVSVISMYPPERIRIVQLDGDSVVVDSEEYEPGKVPESLTPEQETDYIVAETYKTDTDGNETITRELYGRNDQFLYTFVCRDDGVCIKRMTELKWTGEHDMAQSAG